jgi:hypothetical protein
MKNKSRLIAYIFLNILISAATTLGVLWLWDQIHPQPQTSAGMMTPAPSRQESSSQSAQETVEKSTTSEPALTFINEDIQVIIRTIVGAGNLDVEYVEIFNQSEGPVDLSGWQLKDENDNTFVFPALILNSEGSVKVLTKQGTNTVIELYWQADVPIWQSGEVANLTDANGNSISTYSIP